MVVYVPPTSINVPGDATGLGYCAFHPYTKVHSSVTAFVDRGAWDTTRAATYAVNDVVLKLVPFVEGGITSIKPYKFVCIRAHSNTTAADDPAITRTGLATWLPMLNSMTPVYFPGHANYVQATVPQISQWQNSDESATQQAWPDISQEFLWWLAFGWAPGDALNKHTIRDARSTRSGTIGARNTLQLRGPNLRYSFDWIGLRWGLGSSRDVVDQYGKRRLDWPLVDEFCIEDLNLDFNRSRCVENDSRWAQIVHTKMLGNTTSWREFAERGITWPVNPPKSKYQVGQIGVLDRGGIPLTIDPTWGSLVSPGGSTMISTQVELEIIGSFTPDPGISLGTWAVGTTYNTGQKVSYTTTMSDATTAIVEYVCMRDGNIGHVPDYYTGEKWWQVANSQLYIERIYQVSSTTSPTARHSFTGLATKDSPVITAVDEVVNPGWVGVVVQGGGLPATTVVKILSTTPTSFTLDYPITLSGTDVRRSFTTAYIPAETTRQIEGRSILGLRRDLLAINSTSSFPMFEPASYVHRYDPVTRLASIRADTAYTEFTGAIPAQPPQYKNGYSGSISYIQNDIVLYLNQLYRCQVSSSLGVLPTNTTNWVTYSMVASCTVPIDTPPLAAWVGRTLGSNSAGLGQVGAAPTVTAIDTSARTVTMSQPGGTAGGKPALRMKVLYSDGPINETTFSQYGGYGLLYLTAGAIFTGGRIGVSDPVARSLTLYDATPSKADDPPYSRITKPYFVAVHPLTTTTDAKVTIDRPWVSSTAYKRDAIVTSGGSGWVALADSTGVTPGSDGTKWGAYTLMTSEWIGGEVETFLDPVFGARPTVATVTAIGPNGGLGLTANQFQVSTPAVLAKTATIYAVRAPLRKANIDIPLPTQFPFKGAGMQLLNISSPYSRTIPYSPRDAYNIGTTPFRPRALLVPGTNQLTYVQAHLVNSWVPWHASASPELWWYGVDPDPTNASWINVRGVSDDNGIIPFNAKITGVDKTDPLNVKITLDKTIGAPPGTTDRGTWTSGTSYSPNDIVSYNPGAPGSAPTAIYKNIVATSSAPPTTTGNWTVLQPTTVYIDDQPRSRITQRCRFYDSTVTLGSGADTAAGGLEMSNGRPFQSGGNSLFAPGSQIYWDCYDDSNNPAPGVTDPGIGSIFFNWHSVQIRAASDIEIDHIVNQWTWADTWNFGPAGGKGAASQHPLAPSARMQAENIWVHDVFCDGTGRQHHTVQGNSGYNFERNVSMHCKRWYADNESTGSARGSGIRIADSIIDCGGSGDLLSVVPAFDYADPPKLLTNVQLTNGSTVATIQPGSLNVINCVNGDYQGGTVTLWPVAPGLTDPNTASGQVYFHRQLGWDSIDLSAPFTGTTGVYSIMLRDAVQMRNWKFERNTVTSGLPGANIDSYLSKVTIQEYSAVVGYFETRSGGLTVRINSMAARDDATDYSTPTSAWINKRIAPLGPTWQANTLVLEIGPYVVTPNVDRGAYSSATTYALSDIVTVASGDRYQSLAASNTNHDPTALASAFWKLSLPTSAHLRVNKAPKSTNPSTAPAQGDLCLLPSPWVDWKFDSFCVASKALYAGNTAGQATGKTPLFTLGRHCDYVTVTNNVIPATDGGAEVHMIGWRTAGGAPSFQYLTIPSTLPSYLSTTSYASGTDVQSGGERYTSLTDANQGNTPASSPTFWKLIAHGPPPGFPHWTKSGNYFYSSPDNDLNISQALTFGVSFDASPHPNTTPIVVTVTVTTTDGGTPDGYLIFGLDLDPAQRPNGAQYSRVSPIVNGVATATFPLVADGFWYLSVRYTGGCTPHYRFSELLGTGIIVGQGGASSLAVASSVNPSPTGTPPTFMATLTMPDGSSPLGRVEFLIDGTTVASRPLSGLSPNTATYTPASLSDGTHTVKAQFTGAQNSEYWSQQGAVVSPAQISQISNDGSDGVRFILDMTTVWPTNASYTADTPNYGDVGVGVADTIAAGLKTLVTITYAPDWLIGAGFNGRKVPSGSQVATYADMCQRAVRDIGLNVTAWEIWNAANDPAHNAAPTNSTYRPLLSACVLAMRSSAPETYIMPSGPVSLTSRTSEYLNKWDAGAVTGTGISPATFLDGLFNSVNGIVAGRTPGTAYVDAYAIQIFPVANSSPLALEPGNLLAQLDQRIPGTGNSSTFPNGFTFWHDIIAVRESYDPNAPPISAKKIWAVAGGVPSSGTFGARTYTESAQAADALTILQAWRQRASLGPFIWYVHEDNPSSDALAQKTGLRSSTSVARQALTTFTGFATSGITASPPRTSLQFNQVVGSAVTLHDTTIVISGGPNPSLADTLTLFAATITSDTSLPTSPPPTVTFYDGVIPLATVAVSSNSAGIGPTFSAGLHAISAHYNGDGTHNPSVSNVINLQVNDPVITVDRYYSGLAGP